MQELERISEKKAKLSKLKEIVEKGQSIPEEMIPFALEILREATLDLNRNEQEVRNADEIFKSTK